MPERTITVADGTTCITWTESARKTYEDMAMHVGAMVRHYGEDSKQARRAAQSFVQVTTNIHGWGDVKILRDGPLSLLMTSPSFVMGVIWHEDKRKCVNDGCNAYIGSDGKPYWYGGADDRKDCEHHTPNVALDAPMPGEWSCHS